MKIAIGSDHAGYEYKEMIKSKLGSELLIFNDLGTSSADSVDYPDFAHAVAENVENHKADIGILICGSANGVAMTANKHQNIRAAVCWNKEIAQLAKAHNSANVLCIPARYTEPEDAIVIAQTFIKSEFEGGRHSRRVEKISC
ncbi:MAG: ribose 5-phosphate isomerase B [Bacteroidia bacterium]|nr:ribose 5-phosphate isomerase B [Bacteroidia bacterium]